MSHQKDGNDDLLRHAILIVDVLQKLRRQVKTRLGELAFIAIKGTDAVVAKVAKGIDLAAGALNYIIRVMKEHTEEK
jgi:hypothetical protein